jgi:hypothetical protein
VVIADTCVVTAVVALMLTVPLLVMVALSTLTMALAPRSTTDASMPRKLPSTTPGS